MTQKSARNTLLAKYAALYRPAPNCAEGVCAYCGLPADSKDHVPSLSFVAEMGTMHCFDNKIPLVLVPSCRECNSILGNKLLPTFEERRHFIAKKLKTRYGKYARLRKWDFDEIAEIGRGLKPLLCGMQDARSIALRRIAFAESEI